MEMSTQNTISSQQNLDSPSRKVIWQVTAYVKLVSRPPASRPRRIVNYLLLNEPEMIAGLSLEDN